MPETTHNRKENVTCPLKSVTKQAPDDGTAAVIYRDLAGHAWQWFLTANLPGPIDDVEEVEAWKRMLFNVLVQQSGQVIGAKGLYLARPNPHFHVLFVTTQRTGRLFKPTQLEAWYMDGLKIGTPGYDGLHSVRYNKLKDKWRLMTGGYMTAKGISGGCSLKILKVEDAAPLARYIAGPRNVSRYGQQWEYLAPVKVRLLKKCRIDAE